MGIGLPIGGGIGGLVILLLISALTGTNPLDLLTATTSPQESVGTSGATGNDEQAQFVSVVLRDTEDTWGGIFRERGQQYVPPMLVLFTDATQTGCGVGQAVMGPFYCPEDRKVYLDLSFFRELGEKYGAPGDFAEAYVIAHEVGHHVQTLLGLPAGAGAGGSARDRNAASVRVELQADCYAGVWGHYAATRGLLEPGDAEEGLRAAAAIGDDTLQRETEGRVVPESFTHGTSAQRVQWLRTGLDSGRVESCDTSPGHV